MSNFENLKEASVLQNLKFAPKSPEHSQAIQEKLFSLGYSWKYSGNKVGYKHIKYLYTYQDGDIGYDISSNVEVFLRSESKDLTETFVPLKLKLDGTLCYLEGVEIPEGAEIAVKESDSITFLREKDDSIQVYDGLAWNNSFNPYKYSLFAYSQCLSRGCKIIWRKDTPRLSDKVNVTKEQLDKISLETLKKYAEVKPSEVDSSKYIKIIPTDVIDCEDGECGLTNYITGSFRKDLYTELKLVFFQKFLFGTPVQYRIGKGVGSDKSQWHNLTWESLKDMKHDAIEFREKPKHVSIDGIIFKNEESLLKYVRKNFDLK